MRVLFLCTAHNSLSQRLYLALSLSHHVTIEFALSEETMISAVALSQPDIIICPFLTSLVPKCIYENYLTLIIHPGPPGDAGPSALDWVLMGDDGSIDASNEVLRALDEDEVSPGRTHWGITILQAIEEFDAGPVWAFDQFSIDIDQPGLTKSELYRGPVTQSAINATLAAISRVQAASPSGRITTTLKTKANFRALAVSDSKPFQGGRLHHRPLLKAAQRDFDVSRHTSQQVSRRIRCGDSQPGALSKVFGSSLYVYGGVVDDNEEERWPIQLSGLSPRILGFRNKAVCIATCDGKGVWITHVRRMRTKVDKALWPKVPATFGLLQLGIITPEDVRTFDWCPPDDWKLSSFKTFQEVWVDFDVDDAMRRTAYVYFDFYNGAMATDQCSHLIEAFDHVLSQSTSSSPVQAVVLMGGAYFSNGIALNVIEAAVDPAMESWLNINRIDDVVQYLLQDFPSRNILTIAAIRGNAAAGGVALAAACDIVIAGQKVVLNPAYRALGLYGSEYHTISYRGRCGQTNANKILRSMTPISPLQAQQIGLVDYVFPGTGAALDDYIRTHIAFLLKPGIITQGVWKRNINLSSATLARARAHELGEMSLDFWSERSPRYHTRRFAFVRKLKPSHTPLRFAIHRRGPEDTSSSSSSLDEEELEEFENLDYHRRIAEERLFVKFRGRLVREIEEEAEEEKKKNQEKEREREKEKVALLQRKAAAAAAAGVAIQGIQSPPPEISGPLLHGGGEAEEGPGGYFDKKKKSMEPMWSCYYHHSAAPMLLPPTTTGSEELLTPPVTPLGVGSGGGEGTTEQLRIDRAINAAVARRCAEERPWAMIS